MKHLMRLMLVLLLSILLVSCVDEVPELELSTPTNVSITNGVVTWAAVQDAEEYIVTVNQIPYTVTTTQFNLTTLTLVAGTYQVTVTAKSGTVISTPSQAVTYTVQVQVEDNALQTLISNALQVIDLTYTPNRTEASFDEPSEYRQYQMELALVQSYSQTLLQMGKTPTVALNMFTHIHSTVRTMDEVENFSDLREKLDVFSTYQMTPDQASLVLYNMLSTALPHMLINMGIDKDEYLEEYEDQLASIALFKTSTDAVNFYNTIQSKLQTQDIPLLQDFFDLDMELYEFEELMYIIGYEMVPDILYQINNPHYMSSNVPHLELFYKYFLALYNEDPQLLNQYLYTSYPSLFYPIMSYMYELDNINWYLRRISDIEQNMEYVVALQLLMLSEHQLFKNSLSDVVEYLSLLYDTVTPTLTLALDNFIENEGDITMDEVFILKDEILYVLIETLPTPEDFGNMYKTLFHIATIFTDINPQQAIPHANYLGALDHAMLDLFLAFVDTVDQETVLDLMDLFDGLYLEVPYEYTYYDYYYDEMITDIMYSREYQIEVAIEIALYVGHFIESFLEDNQAKADHLQLLLEDQQLEDIITLLVESLLDVASQEMDPEEFEMVETIVSLVLADLDSIKAGLEVFKNIGASLIVEFLATDAKFFYDIISLQNLDSNPFEKVFLDQMEVIIDSFIGMNNALMLELDLDSIEAMLRMVRVPLMVAAMFELDMSEAEFNDLFEDLVSDIALVLFNLRQFELRVVSVVSGLELDELLVDNNWNLVEFQVMYAAIVITLDEVFNDTYKDLLFDTIDVLQAIIGHEFLLDALNITSTDVLDMKEMFIDDFEYLLDQISIISQFDFTQTTLSQIEQLESLFEFQFQLAGQPN